MDVSAAGAQQPPYWGGVGAGVLVIGMALGAIYGRYHYVSDIVAGMLLGVFALWASGFFG